MMLNKAIYAIALSLFLYLGACSNPNIKVATAENIAQQVYFDIPLFFEQQAQKLGKQKVHKTIQYADKSESQEISFSSVEQWQKEFALFSQVQLNTPSLSNAYTIDTLYNANDTLHFTVRYTAKNPEKLYAQSVDIYFKKPNQVKSIGLVLFNDNLLAATNYFLQYEVDKGYNIHVTKKLLLANSSQLHLSALFMPQ